MADIHVAIVEACRAGKTHVKVAEFFGMSRARVASLSQQAEKHGMEYIRGIRKTVALGRVGHKLSEEDYGKKVLARILKRTKPEGDCLMWLGFKYQSRGSTSWYGSTNYHARNWRVHRLVAHLTQRPAKTGECVMHTCDNSLCVNPAHLSYGTLQENLRDAKLKGSYRYHESHYKTCKHGHEFTPENTYVTKQGFRQCKECARRIGRERWKKYPEHMRERLRQQRAAKRAGDVP